METKKIFSGETISFFLALLTATVIFLPFLIIDKGFFTYCGDFNSQQIPFYMFVNDAIRSNAGEFSFATDLGSQFISSYSFYNLGSPFFWVTLLFDRMVIPYLMVPLLCVKFAFCSLFAYIYAKRYIKSRNMAIISGILYAFCGFNIYNIFFNHFIDAAVLFPLLLISLDMFIYDKRRGFFAFAVAINLLNSFFFFTGEVVFLVIYFVAKLATKEYSLSLKQFALLFFEATLGVLMGLVIALPSAFAVAQNPRAIKFADGFNLLLHGTSQQYFAIISSMFLPPDPPYLPNIFTDGVVKWTSMSAFLPIVSVAGGVAYIKKYRNSAFSYIMLTCTVMALVPALNSFFYAANSSYYARWYYMPILILALCTAKSLESFEIPLLPSILTVWSITFSFIVFGLVPKKDADVYIMGVAQYASKFWLTFFTAMLSITLFYCVVRFYRSSAYFSRIMLSAIIGFTVFYSVTHIALGKLPQLEGDKNYKLYNYDSLNELKITTDDDYRIDNYETYDNIGLFMNKPSIQFFNSTVAPNILKFYPSIGVKRDVSSKPEHDMYAVRGLLSVKYLYTYPEKQEEYEKKYGDYGFNFIGNEASYAVYENENYVPMGFTYNYYITKQQFESVLAKTRSNVLMRAILLDDQVVNEYSNLFEPLSSQFLSDFTYESFVRDAKARAKAAATTFIVTNTGFTSSISLEKDNLVFYSIPYDKGFFATVNGIQADIIEVQNGLMAVKAQKGENFIEFKYKTPYLRLAIAISSLALLCFVVYILLYRFKIIKE